MENGQNTGINQRIEELMKELKDCLEEQGMEFFIYGKSTGKWKWMMELEGDSMEMIIKVLQPKLERIRRLELMRN